MMARAALSHAKLGSSFWIYAVYYAAYVLNRLVHDGLKKRPLKTPLENLLNRPLDEKDTMKVFA